MKPLDDRQMQELFTTMEPPLGHELRFQSKLMGRRRRKTLVQWSTGIAAVWLFGIIGFSMMKSPVSSLETEDSVSTEFYIQQIHLEQQRLLNQFGEEQPEAVQKMLSQLQKLQTQETTLREKLLSFENYETLLPALMENLQTQLDILQQMKNNLNLENSHTDEDLIF